MLLLQKEDSCTKMFISKTRWSQLPVTYIMETARSLNITEVLRTLGKTMKKTSLIK